MSFSRASGLALRSAGRPDSLGKGSIAGSCGVARRRKWWCIIAVLACKFLLRMPSELFAQRSREMVQVAGGRFIYGPIRRKQRVDLRTLCAFCLCGTDEGICLHTWLAERDQAIAAGGPPFGGYAPATWTAEFWRHLQAIGVANPEV